MFVTAIAAVVAFPQAATVPTTSIASVLVMLPELFVTITWYGPLFENWTLVIDRANGVPDKTVPDAPGISLPLNCH
jgi:hypothetical protein